MNKVYYLENNMEMLNGHFIFLQNEKLLFYLAVYSEESKEIKTQGLENFFARKGLSMSEFLSIYYVFL